MTRSGVVLRGMHVCDHVMRDGRGLPILAGIYPGKIRASTKPYFLQVFVYATFEVQDGKSHTVNIELSGPGSRGLGTIEVHSGTKYFDIEAAMLLFSEAEDSIKTKWRVDGGRWANGPDWGITFTDFSKLLSDDEKKSLRKMFRSRAEINPLFDEIKTIQLKTNY